MKILPIMQLNKYFISFCIAISMLITCPITYGLLSVANSLNSMDSTSAVNSLSKIGFYLEKIDDLSNELKDIDGILKNITFAEFIK